MKFFITSYIYFLTILKTIKAVSVKINPKTFIYYFLQIKGISSDEILDSIEYNLNKNITKMVLENNLFNRTEDEDSFRKMTNIQNSLIRKIKGKFEKQNESYIAELVFLPFLSIILFEGNEI